MAFVPAVNTAKVTLALRYQGERCLNVFYTKKGGPFVAGDLASIAALVVGWWDVEVKPEVPAEVTLDKVQVRDMTTANSESVEQTSALAGTGGGTVMPASVTLAMSLRTALTGRSYHGRLYHVGLVEADITGNNISTVKRDALASAYNALVGELGAPAVPPTDLSVASFYSGVDGNGNPIPRAAAVVTPVTTITADLRVDTQRRRLPRVS